MPKTPGAAKHKVKMQKRFYYDEKVHSNWDTYVLKRTEIRNVQETLALKDPMCFSEFKSYEKVQGLLNGMRTGFLDSTIEIVNADKSMKEKTLPPHNSSFSRPLGVTMKIMLSLVRLGM